MKHRSIFTALLAFTLVSVHGEAKANPLDKMNTSVIALLQPPQTDHSVEARTKVYKIKSGDTLEKIAKKYKSTSQRLFDKNKSIKHPDTIKVGAVISIPTNSERLEERVIVAEPISTTIRATSARQAPVQSSGNIAGNTYYAGQCTAYVKDQRPDVSNTWGDAISWFHNAKAQGWATGDTPRVGAVAWARGYGHVAVVRKILNNGTILIQEQNYKGAFIISSRIAPTSEFRYIY